MIDEALNVFISDHDDHEGIFSPLFRIKFVNNLELCRKVKNDIVTRYCD